jgi:hypothetical protein
MDIRSRNMEDLMKSRRRAIVLIIACLAAFSLHCGKSGTSTTVTRYVCSGTASDCLRLAAGWDYQAKLGTAAGFANASAVRLPDGRIRLYGNQPVSGETGLFVVSYISDDGIAFTQEDGYRFSGDDATVPFVIILPDGRFRMYCTDRSITIGTDGARAVISAISDDGLNFTREPGDRLTYSGTGEETGGIYGSAVILLPDGTYRMYYQGREPLYNVARILSAVSSDGLSWTRESGVRLDPRDLCPVSYAIGGPLPYLDGNGVFHLFVSGNVCEGLGGLDLIFGIFDATSSDGLTFSVPKSPMVQGYYEGSNYKGNATDPYYTPGNPIIVPTTAGFAFYFYLFYSSGAIVNDLGFHMIFKSSFP